MNDILARLKIYTNDKFVNGENGTLKHKVIDESYVVYEVDTWNVEGYTQPTIEQLEAITQEQIDNYLKVNTTKDDLFKACLSYLKETDFKYNLDYIRRKEEDLSITAVRTECSIYCGDYYDESVVDPSITIEKIKAVMKPDDKYKVLFGELLN